jgi:hypothetical protein
MLSRQDITISNVVFDGAGVAGGFACIFCNHVIIDRCFVYRFYGNGILAYDGHENYISNSWISQCNFNDAGPAATVNGTGISLQSSDSRSVAPASQPAMRDTKQLYCCMMFCRFSSLGFMLEIDHLPRWARGKRKGTNMLRNDDRLYLIRIVYVAWWTL